MNPHNVRVIGTRQNIQLIGHQIKQHLMLLYSLLLNNLDSDFHARLPVCAFKHLSEGTRAENVTCLVDRGDVFVELELLEVFEADEFFGAAAGCCESGFVVCLGVDFLYFVERA